LQCSHSAVPDKTLS